jgi:UDP-2,3-diacylglucosamine pyrophosphatase LpxH
MSAIIAFSDVHLGYEQSDSEAFITFIHSLQGRDDLGDVVIVGDLVDLWRRDVVGLGFELSRFVEELKSLQEKAEVHYVYGNHDAHVSHLEDHAYPFKAEPSLTLTRFGYTLRFLHGHQCDPIQNIPLGPETSEILCWTLSDDIGGWKSKLWDMFGPRSKLSKEDFAASIDLLMSPPEDERRKDALTRKFAGVTEFVECLKAYLKITAEKEFLVYGHTHKPFIDLGKRVANTGCWLKGARPANTYFEFGGWPPFVAEFNGNKLTPTSVTTLKF